MAKCVDCRKYPRKYGRLCAPCQRDRRAKVRTARWEGGERPTCATHPDREVGRAFWIRTGGRKCASCRSKNSLGLPRPAQIRHRNSEKTRQRKNEFGRGEKGRIIKSRYKRKPEVQEHNFWQEKSRRLTKRIQESKI